MRWVLAAAAVCCVAAATGPRSAHADRIHYIDGRVRHGVVVRRSEKSVTVRVGSSEIQIPNSLIQEISPGTPGDHHLLAAKAELAAGNVREGIVLLGRAAEEEADPLALAAEMMRFEKEIEQTIVVLTTAERRALRSALWAIEGAVLPRQGELLISRLIWGLELGDLDAVHRLLGELLASERPALGRRRAELAQRMGRNVDVALEEARFSDAIDLLIELRRLDTEQAGGKKVELVLLWARSELDRGLYAEALEIYVNHLLETSPSIAHDRIANALMEAEREYRSSDELTRAIELYDNYGLTILREMARDRLVGLWSDLGWQYLRRGQIATARQMFTRSEILLVGSARKDLLQCDYYEAKAMIDADDYVGQFELGEWCRQYGLFEEARRSFEVALGSEVLRPEAMKEIRGIDEASVEIELSRLLDRYEAGDYRAVISGVQALRPDRLPKLQRGQAEELRRLAREAMRLLRTEKPQQAELLWQQAERAYYGGQRAEAARILEALIDRYAGTPAAERGRQFYRTIGPRLELDRIERRRRGRGGGYIGEDDASDETSIAREIRRLRAGDSATRVRR